jgi:hypothetical protein
LAERKAGWRGVGREVRDVRVLGREGVVNGLGVVVVVVVLAVGFDLSDMGGDGGVGVSLTPEEDVLAGGVSNDASVVVGESSDRGEAEVLAMGVIAKEDVLGEAAFSSFSRMMSVSIFRSDNSSFKRCASIRNCSRSVSPARTSSSSMMDFSIVWLYFDSISSSEDSVFLCFRSKSSLATSMSRSRSCRVLLVSRSSVISFCRAF